MATFLVAGATVALAAPPGNDNFAARTPLSGITGQIDGTNVEATGEAGEPVIDSETSASDSSPIESVWYDWTTQVSGPATVNTCVSSYDTMVAVYTGDTVGGLTLVASNDDACPSGGGSNDLGSEVPWSAVAGTNYKIQVDGFLSAEGTFTLRFSQCTIDGSSGNDNIVGTNGDDVICAGGGDDTISGRRGNDTILGEDGNDLAQPGGGNDQFDGGNGTDEINYNEAAVTGNATIHLGTQTATAPGAGSDTLVSVENATGSSFDDTITGSGGNNVISGRDGNDTSNGKGGNDTIDGKAGNDTLTGENGNDTLVGGAGGDSLNGNAGADTLNGVDGVGGNDTVNGGSDFDVDSCSADPGDTVVNCP
jgi:Ca2+-binding RTX toxin-like protein